MVARILSSPEIQERPQLGQQQEVEQQAQEQEQRA